MRIGGRFGMRRGGNFAVRISGNVDAHIQAYVAARRSPKLSNDAFYEYRETVHNRLRELLRAGRVERICSKRGQRRELLEAQIRSGSRYH